MSFKSGLIYIITKFVQLNDTANAWNEFPNDKTENNFTNLGVVRVNESIIGSGTALDVQKQFVANIDNAINSPVDKPSSIKRYQDVLQYAQSKVDYGYAQGLYMSLSNMELNIGQVIGYNNKIVIASTKTRYKFRY